MWLLAAKGAVDYVHACACTCTCMPGYSTTARRLGQSIESGFLTSRSWSCLQPKQPIFPCRRSMYIMTCHNSAIQIHLIVHVCTCIMTHCRWYMYIHVHMYMYMYITCADTILMLQLVSYIHVRMH